MFFKPPVLSIRGKSFLVVCSATFLVYGVDSNGRMVGGDKREASQEVETLLFLQERIFALSQPHTSYEPYVSLEGWLAYGICMKRSERQTEGRWGGLRRSSQKTSCSLRLRTIHLVEFIFYHE